MRKTEEIDRLAIGLADVYIVRSKDDEFHDNYYSSKETMYCKIKKIKDALKTN
jgi:hypothetical protein